MRATLFGSSSENRSGPDAAPRERTPQKSRGPSEQDKLAFVDIPHELRQP